MKSIVRILPALIILLLPGLARAQKGFVSLFNGKSLAGWESPDLSCWSIRDGAITGSITQEKPIKSNQYLVWHEPMADFELKIQFRMFGSPGINSGFQFRSRILPGHDMAGYQMDNNLDTPWLCRLYEEHGRDTLAFRGSKANIDANGKVTLSDIPDAQTTWFRLDTWHEYHLICQGSHLTLYVNGKLAAEALDGDPRHALSGQLGLQLHTGPPMTVQFRNIRLRTLAPGDTPSTPTPFGHREPDRALHDKTLVAWASPADLDQHGGSILTIDDLHSHFDALVYGEISPRRWMAGSDFVRRTMHDQSGYPAETVQKGHFVQIAAVYAGNTVRLYRDGEMFSEYQIGAPQPFDPRRSAVLIGLRHLEANDHACFKGSVMDARIYAAPLSAEQLRRLHPGSLAAGEVRPIAWWNFSTGSIKDQMRLFPAARLMGSATVAGGELQLDGSNSYMVTPPSAVSGIK